jgi:hypothetical protein
VIIKIIIIAVLIVFWIYFLAKANSIRTIRNQRKARERERGEQMFVSLRKERREVRSVGREIKSEKKDEIRLFNVYLGCYLR